MAYAVRGLGTQARMIPLASSCGALEAPQEFASSIFLTGFDPSPVGKNIALFSLWSDLKKKRLNDA